MSSAEDLADFDTFCKHVKTRCDSPGLAGSLVLCALLGLGFMFYWKSQAIGDLDRLPLVEQYFLTVDDGESTPSGGCLYGRSSC
jgi:hypothetical protein